MQKFLLSTLIVMSLGISACVFAPPRDGRDGNDNRHEQRRDDNDRHHEQRGDENDRRDQGHDGRN